LLTGLWDYVSFGRMTIELPDIEGFEGLSEADLRLELACALYERGRVGKVGGAELAGLNLFEFQHALRERRIACTTNEMFESDLATLKALFSE
jgi:predicted HTH domain antitoxin